MTTSCDAFFTRVYTALMYDNVEQKINAVSQLQTQFLSGQCCPPKSDSEHKSLTSDNTQIAIIEQPGRPAKPELVSPAKLKSRGLGSEQGRASFVHAIAHIEFNAINLALDALYRFRHLPLLYYQNWLQVANEEAKHFTLLDNRLAQLGYRYGDFPAHDGLWDMAKHTADSLLARMALIPMVFEARGLDVTPDMIARLQQVGDTQTADILQIILNEEVGHVAFGRHWFEYECKRCQLEPRQTLIDLIKQRMPGRRLGPFNYDYRAAAGFAKEELHALERL